MSETYSFKISGIVDLVDQLGELRLQDVYLKVQKYIILDEGVYPKPTKKLQPFASYCTPPKHFLYSGWYYLFLLSEIHLCLAIIYLGKKLKLV